MKQRLKLYFETAVVVFCIIGAGAIIWWFFSGLYTLEHPTKVVHFNQGPQDPVDTH
jgi:hypothetical protein